MSTFKLYVREIKTKTKKIPKIKAKIHTCIQIINDKYTNAHKCITIIHCICWLREDVEDG